PFVYLDCAPFKKPGLCPGFSHIAPSFLLFPTKLCFANFRGGPSPAGLFVYAARNPHQPAAFGRKAAGFHFSVTSCGWGRDKLKTISTDLSFCGHKAREREPTMDLLQQCARWHEEGAYQNIIDAIEALPADQRTPELDSELARAYNN